MSQLTAFLCAHGLMLATGITPLLLAGVLLATIVRSPVLRQRICELTVVAAIVWAVLAILPLPRLTTTTPKDGLIRPTQIASAGRPLPSVEIPADLIAPFSGVPVGPLAVPETSATSPISLAPTPAISAPAVQNHPTISIAPFDWQLLATRTFLAGAALCASWLALGQILLRRMIRRSTPAPGLLAPIIAPHIRPHHKSPAILITPRLSRPITCGVRHPVILLPESLLAPDHHSQLRQVLLHELGHVHQRDARGSLLFCLALPLLYWHPAYWWLHRCASLSRELVADDWAARADGKEAYVTQLVALARTRMTGLIAGPVGAIGILQSRSHFYRRMRMLLQRPNPLATNCSRSCRAAMGAITLAVVIGMAATIGVRPANAQTAPATVAENKPAPDRDHVIAPGDLLTISVGELTGPGAQSASQARVATNGTVKLPLLGGIKAEGLTTAGLEQAINQRYRDANLVNNAPISVALADPNAPDAPTPGPAGKVAPGAADVVGGGRPATPQLTARFEDQDASDAQVDSLRARIDVLKKHREELDYRIAQLRAKGYADEHPEVRQLRDQEDASDKRLAATEAEARDLQAKLADLRAQRTARGPRPNDIGAAVPGADAAGRMPSAAAIGGVQLDLVNLANKIVDTAGEVRVAKVQVALRQRLAKAGGADDLSLATDQAKLDTAVKRLELLKGIATIALDGAKVDYQRANQLFQQGVQGQREVTDAESKFKMLELIVKSAE